MGDKIPPEIVKALDALGAFKHQWDTEGLSDDPDAEKPDPPTLAHIDAHYIDYQQLAAWRESQRRTVGG